MQGTRWVALALLSLCFFLGFLTSFFIFGFNGIKYLFMSVMLMHDYGLIWIHLTKV